MIRITKMKKLALIINWEETYKIFDNTSSLIYTKVPYYVDEDIRTERIVLEENLLSFS